MWSRRGPGNSGSVISGSLASPKPPGGGKPEERGDEETRRNHGATFKAQVALAAVKGDKTLAELSEQFHVHPTQGHRMEAAIADAGRGRVWRDETDVRHTGS